MVLADGIVVRDNTSVGGGKGLFVTIPIKKGEWIWREDPDNEPQYTSAPRTLAWVEALPAEAQKAYRHFMCAPHVHTPLRPPRTPSRAARYKTGEDRFESLPEFNDLSFDQYAGVTSSDPSM